VLDDFVYRSLTHLSIAVGMHSGAEADITFLVFLLVQCSLCDGFVQRHIISAWLVCKVDSSTDNNNGASIAP